MGRNSNSGGALGDMELEFNAFDRLPKEVRQAIANAPVKLCALALARKRWNKAEMLAGVERAIINPLNRT